MPKVVVTRPIPEAGLAAVRAAHEVVVHEGGQVVEEARLIELLDGAEALIATITDPITEALFAACPHLGIVARFGVGLDNVDLEAARRHQVVVTNTPGVLTDSTADFAFALLLAVARRLPEADAFVREGKFKRWETMELLGVDLRGKQLGIVGLGRIGAAMARRALGFGMEVVYSNRRRANLTVEREVCARFVSLDELLETSDVISLHCPLNDDSRHLLDRAAFRKMKPTALLVNTARGPIVDETALVKALETEEIAGAGLDVFEHEPEVHPGLLKHPRVVVAPHLGSATVETRTRMAEMCAEAVLAFFAGEEKIQNRVV